MKEEEKEKMTEEEFVIRSIKRLREGMSPGIHRISSGFDAAFRKYFGTDPLVAIKRLAAEGKIEIQGDNLFLSGEVPIKSTKKLNVPDSEKQNMLLGFLALYETLNHDGYLGAILISDFQGIPQEFRCTHPVKPTIIQRPLYGDTLESYIGVTLCGLPLISSIQNKPSLIVVHKEFLLGVRTATHCPVIFVRKVGEAIDIKTPNGLETKLRRERVDCPTGRFQPIVFAPHPDFNDDITSAREILEKIFSYLDPVEPFERMAKAIEVLGKQDKRFQ